jgi:hypothetical protein
MAQEVTNFARFYLMFNKLDHQGDKEGMKCDLVRQATNGRTESLREVTRSEYEELCRMLEKTTRENVINESVKNAIIAEQKRQRSIALHMMQVMGVDTTDWNRINALCQDPRIAGKLFAQLTAEELAAMTKRLRIIYRKGGFKTLDEDEPKATIIKMY